MIIIIFFLALPTVLTLQSCSSALCSNHSATQCSSDGYCMCRNDNIFNCTIQGTSLSQGSYSITFASSSTSYIILDNTIGQQLEYSIYFSDASQSSISSAYSFGFYIDNGVGSSYSYPSGYITYSDTTIDVYLRQQFSYIGGSSIPQKLILKIKYNVSSSTKLNFAYSFNPISSNFLLIIAYIAGGILTASILIFIIMMCRRNRAQQMQQPGRQREHRHPKQQDIAHFVELMPATSITVQDKKDGRTCSVCLVELDFNSQVRETPCNHIFHEHCIDEWCKKSLTCPLCRTSLTAANIKEIKVQKLKVDTKDQSSWIMNTFDQQDSNEQQEEGSEVSRVEVELRQSLQNGLENASTSIRQPLNVSILQHRNSLRSG